MGMDQPAWDYCLMDLVSSVDKVALGQRRKLEGDLWSLGEKEQIHTLNVEEGVVKSQLGKG